MSLFGVSEKKYIAALAALTYLQAYCDYLTTPELQEQMTIDEITDAFVKTRLKANDLSLVHEHLKIAKESAAILTGLVDIVKTSNELIKNK